MAVPFEPSAALEVQRAHRETLGRQQLVGNTHLLPGTHRPEDGQDGTRPVSHGSRKKGCAAEQRRVKTSCLPGGLCLPEAAPLFLDFIPRSSSLVLQTG